MFRVCFRVCVFVLIFAHLLEAEEDLVQAVFSPLNDLQFEPAIRGLLVQPKILPKVVDILVSIIDHNRP